MTEAREPHIRHQDGRLEVSGTVTADNVLTLRAAGEALIARVAAEGQQTVQVDLAGLKVASSVLLSLLLCWVRTAANAGAAVEFAGQSAALAELARLNGVESLLFGTTMVSA